MGDYKEIQSKVENLDFGIIPEPDPGTQNEIVSEGIFRDTRDPVEDYELLQKIDEFDRSLLELGNIPVSIFASLERAIREVYTGNPSIESITLSAERVKHIEENSFDSEIASAAFRLIVLKRILDSRQFFKPGQLGLTRLIEIPELISTSKSNSEYTNPVRRGYYLLCKDLDLIPVQLEKVIRLRRNPKIRMFERDSNNPLVYSNWVVHQMNSGLKFGSPQEAVLTTEVVVNMLKQPDVLGISYDPHRGWDEKRIDLLANIPDIRGLCMSWLLLAQARAIAGRLWIASNGKLSSEEIMTQLTLQAQGELNRVRPSNTGDRVDVIKLQTQEAITDFASKMGIDIDGGMRTRKPVIDIILSDSSNR